MKKKLLLFLCLLSIAIGQSKTLRKGEIFHKENLRYTVIDDVNNYVSIGKISSNSCPTGTLTIPITVKNEDTTYAITYIVDNAFDSCVDLTSVIIPNTVTYIGREAFIRCIGILGVSLPSGITTIKPYTFFNCTSLTNIIIPNAVTSIEQGAFENCTSLKGVSLPIGLNSIGKYAFETCTSLTSVSLPDGLTTIGQYAFKNCKALSSVTFPDSLATIERYAFYDCSALESIELPESLINLETEVFYGCSALKSVSFPSNLVGFGASVFKGCVGLTTITIPTKVTAIGDFCFANCSALETVNIPKSIKYIGSKAFSNCTALKSVAVHWETRYDINYAGIEFQNVFENVAIENIPLSVPSGSQTLYQNTPIWQDFSLFMIFFNDGMLEYTVTDTTNNYVSVNKHDNTCPTDEFAIPETVIDTESSITYTITSIADNAFEDCSNLTRIALPDGLAGNGERGTFEAYNGLRRTSSTNALTSIGASAFKNCTGLTSINIPESVTDIKNFAFENCSGLTNVTVNWDTPLTIDANVFENVVIENIPLTIPSGTKSAYQVASVWKDFGSYVLSIPDVAVAKVRLNPNPTTTFLNIELSSASQLNRTSIYNNLGQLISEENNSRINVSNYSKGLYFAQIETSRGQVTKKFIVN